VVINVSEECVASIFGIHVTETNVSEECVASIFRIRVTETNVSEECGAEDRGDAFL
jgi:hypothetical protein